MRRLWLISIAAAVAAGPALAARQKQMSVQVREAQVRGAPGFLSRVLGTLPYTEEVAILEERTDWNRIRTLSGGLEGWLHSSSLTSKRLKLAGDGPDAQVTVSSDEQALAGKGFNSDVEQEFKARNQTADFSVVDKMEKLSIPTESIIQFLNEGDVKPPAGGAH